MAEGMVPGLCTRTFFSAAPPLAEEITASGCTSLTFSKYFDSFSSAYGVAICKRTPSNLNHMGVSSQILGYLPAGRLLRAVAYVAFPWVAQSADLRR